MRMMIAGLVLMGLGGCAYPASTTQQGSAEGELYFPGASSTAMVAVDGRVAGSAVSFSGKYTLAVSPGTHRVVVTDVGSVVLDKLYVVNAGTKVAVKND